MTNEPRDPQQDAAQGNPTDGVAPEQPTLPYATEPAVEAGPSGEASAQSAGSAGPADSARPAEAGQTAEIGRTGETEQLPPASSSPGAWPPPTPPTVSPSPAATSASEVRAGHPYASADGTPRPATHHPAAGTPRDSFGRPVGGPLGAASTPPAAGSDGPAARASGRGSARLVAALAIGALVGGAAGGGVTALVLGANQPAVVQTSDGSGTGPIVINDRNDVNAISAVASNASPSVVTIDVAGQQGAGSGSGVIISDDGYVLTNTHVVTLDGAESTPQIQVTLNDGRIVAAEVVGIDPVYDLAVLQLTDTDDLTPIEFADSSALNVGDTAIAIGAPLGLSGTVTNGIISALNRSITVSSAAAPSTPDSGEEAPEEDGEAPFDFWNFDIPGQENEQRTPNPGSSTISIAVIQTDAAINPGNSGGALLDAQGRLIGINVAIASAGGGATSGNIGVGFAIPSNVAAWVAEEIIEDGTATHGLLGATVTDAATAEDAVLAGALVTEVTTGGAAEQAGIRSGDIVTGFEGMTVADATDLTALVRSLPAGSEAEIDIVRDGDAQTVTVTLGELAG